MKSISIILKPLMYTFAGMLLIAFTSCTKTVSAPQSETYLYTAKSNDWQFISASNTWEYYTSIPAIDSYILNNKAVLVYWQDLNSDYSIYTETLMPFTYSGIDYNYITGIDNSGEGYLQVDVTANGNNNPSYTYPTGFKVIIQPN